MRLRYFHVLLAIVSFYFVCGTLSSDSTQNQISKRASHDTTPCTDSITTGTRDGSRKRFLRKGDSLKENLSVSEKEERGTSLVEGVVGLLNKAKVVPILHNPLVIEQAAKVGELKTKVSSPLRDLKLMDAVVIVKLYRWLKNLIPPMRVYKWLGLDRMSVEKQKSHRYYKYYRWYFQEWHKDQAKIEILSI
ncbi:hypothetical protein KXD40_005237 [Peronospora effusa]|uniref:RxLR effector protein n=1 Tax=Peronospora effusa TaxID=542832 RepID=A0A3M6VS34_9STRA|nr:hypothetical protein DD238_003513 [Peronospora effusa]RQM13407.1 hypothetical protein DD237_007673 [Peronospora effusa]UIZ22210.1 hypothetical protein KXD40_005237 [Peronospora effusa]